MDNITTEMWETLIKTFNEIKDNEWSCLETLLPIIKKNLTYDDPGLLPAKILTNFKDRERLEAYNFWLIHQIFYVLSLENNLSSMSKHTFQVQKEIVSASIMKQPWFFDKLIQKYIDLTNICNNVQLTLVKAITISIFKIDLNDMTNDNLQYKTIEIKSEDVLLHFINCTLQLLTHAISLSTDLNENIINKCSCCVLNVLESISFNTKHLCIIYFTKLIKYCNTANKNEKDMIITVCNIIKKIVEMFPLWLYANNNNVNYLTVFNNVVIEFFNELNLLEYKNDNNINQILFKTSLELLVKSCYDDDEKYKIINDNLHNSLIDLLKKNCYYLMNKEKCNIIKDVYPKITKYPKLITILDNFIIEELKESTDKNALYESCTWINVHKHFLLALYELEKNVSNDYKVEDSLLIIKFVFQLTNKVDYSDSNKCVNNEKLCITFFNDEFQNIINQFLNIIKSISIQNIDRYESIMHIALLFCNISDFVKLNDEEQYNILGIILSPFKTIICNEKFSFLLNPLLFDVETLVKLKINAIKCLSDLSTKYLNKEVISLLRHTLNNVIINNIMSGKDNDLKNAIIYLAINFIMNNLCDTNKSYKNFIVIVNDCELNLSISQQTKNFICLLSNKCLVTKIKYDYGIKYKIYCKMCNDLNGSSDVKQVNEVEYKNCLLMINENEIKDLKKALKDSNNIHYIIKLYSSPDNNVRYNMMLALPSVLYHLDLIENEEFFVVWSKYFLFDNLHIRSSCSKSIPQLIKIIMENTKVSQQFKENIIRKILEILLLAVKNSLNKTDQKLQSSVLDMINKMTEYENINEDTLLYCFRMTLFYIIRMESCVVRETLIIAKELCYRHNCTPNNMLNWYKQTILKQIIGLCVSIFLKNDIPLNKSLNNVSKLLGYGGPREFVAKHYKIILAMLLPSCIKYPKCQELLNFISNTIQKDLADTMSVSFITIYRYLFLNEHADINNKCIDYIIQNTGSNLYNLLHTDINKTLPELLIYYHKSPKCVLNAFSSLLSENNEFKCTDMTLKKMAAYIAPRFLGILIYFETSLLDPDNEKSLKIETLLSLGEIIRFMDSIKITEFRFKIMALLNTAVLIKDPDLKSVCTKVWTIFIHTVDVESLGSLLGTIFVSLEPLLEGQNDDINEICKYLVISNASLLSLHISDLFFLKDTKICNEIKQFVTKHLQRTKCSDIFLEKFYTLFKHIRNENIGVRIYGLKYLTRLLEENRMEVNNLVTGQLIMNPIIVQLLDNLMAGCKHADEDLQIASGKCLGELGAIEPSYMPPNYSPQQQNFGLSIHTDEFAIMALGELCRSFQKDPKNTDSCSLAIQEILLERNVDLQNKRKLDVWAAIPEQMKPLMIPLFSSCYTTLQSNKQINVHPVYGSSQCETCEDWACIWASKLIDSVQNDATKHLLKAFKPSIRRDMLTLSTFLPYIVLHSIQNGSSDNHVNIFEELDFVFSNVLNEKPPDINKNRLRGLQTLNFLPIIKTQQNNRENNNIANKCAKLAFSLLDFLEMWLIEFTNRLEININKENNEIDTFLKKFDKKKIAKANFKCGEFARALMYIEAYIEEKRNSRLQNELSFLAEIYAELLDPDSLEGAMCLKTNEPTLPEQILAHNVAGRLQETAVCFERMLQVGNLTPVDMKDMVQCYLGLDQPETALLVSEGLMKQLYEKNMGDILNEASAEPLFRLSRFEELDELVSNAQIKYSNNWGVHCGEILLSFRKGNIKEFHEKINVTRLSVLKMLRTTGIEQNPYQKGYSNVMKLHLISEFEKAEYLIQQIRVKNTLNDSKILLKNLFNEWNARLDMLQPTARIVEPVLCLRRILLNEIKQTVAKIFNEQTDVNARLSDLINEHIGKLWIKSTEFAYNCGRFQQAQLYILNAESYKPKELFLEKAKLFWKKGDQTNAFKTLERGLEDVLIKAPSHDIISLEPDKKKLYAEAKFLIATYNAESMNIGIEENLKYFKESIIANNQSEKCFVHMAQYLDRNFAAMSEFEQEQRKGCETLSDIMSFYGRSMIYGCNNIYQSMPRMLTVWLDFTAKHVAKREEIYQKTSTTMNKTVEHLIEKVPSFIFFTAFSQLISRICHPSVEVYAILKSILVNLILKFPQQSLWMILCIFKSSYASRVKRCTEVLSDIRLSEPVMRKLITDFNSLAERLIELTNKEIIGVNSKPTVSQLVKSLPKLIADHNFSQIVIPTQQYMQLLIPPLSDRDKPANLFNAFPNTLTYINGIKEEMIILPSLQKPRRITLTGNDGKIYAVMMKPKDDLRKDFRLMEFNAVVKQYLFQDPEARQRRLNIRTYAVIPLNEECGIIEWLNDLQAYRSIITAIYKQKQYGMTIRQLRSVMCNANEPLSKKRDIFLNILIPRHPDVFADWFKQRFTTPHNWYQARSSYIKTLAVMSIVGYILGLGDRHGENILFDSRNGDVVHVDFNCLFNKGETFEVPEKVPFRLTHNMIHAMGPLGVEGLFRRCCEIAMRVLQTQTPTLMSILRPFVYDPLVTWSKTKTNDGALERTDPQAMTNVKHIEERLKGLVNKQGKFSNIPLSTEGHVNYVIKEATDVDNLASMYIGWGGYM